MGPISRRTLLTALPAACSLPWLAFASESPVTESPFYPEFPAQHPDRVKEMVGVSHGNKERVRALLQESPALAKASWDWGYGDWETAIGAASHTGNREIALLLLEHGARPDLFTFAMLGMTDVVKAYVAAFPGIQKIKGPHGLTLMHHARQGGRDAGAVLAYLEQVGDADLLVTSFPLSDKEKNIYLGTFGLTASFADKLEVSLSKGGGLSIRKGKEGTARTLYYLGDHQFHPVGAEAVRIRFQVEGGRCTGLSVVDGPSELTATRIS